MQSLLAPRSIAWIETIARQVAENGIAGSVADIGSYRGGLLPMLSTRFPSRMIYAFDTYTGQPERDIGPDDDVKGGEFADAFFDVVEASIGRCCYNCRLRPGYFPDTAVGIGNERFAFATVNLCTEIGTSAALAFLVPRMSPGAVVVISDADRPGVRKAIDASKLPMQDGAAGQLFHVKP